MKKVNRPIWHIYEEQTGKCNFLKMTYFRLSHQNVLKNGVWKIATSVEGCAPTHLKWDQMCQQKSFYQKNIIPFFSYQGFREDLKKKFFWNIS